MKDNEIAILSMLSEQSRHGYEMEQIIEARGMRNWTDIGFSSIYYVLNKLEAAGLIESRMEKPEGQGPARRVYSIQPEGESALKEGVLHALAELNGSHSPLLLGVANLPIVSNQLAVAALRERLEALETRLSVMVQSWEDQKPLPFHVEKMFEYGKTMNAAEMEWIRNLIGELEGCDGKN